MSISSRSISNVIPGPSLGGARPGSLSLARTLFAALLLIAFLALTGAGARAAVKITFEQKDGDKISDVTKIVVKAESGDGIDKVEFRIDDKLRYTGKSIPYIYEWDTLTDKEGAHMLTATAFDSSGQTARTSISLTIDNELSTGADALAQKAQDALAAKDIPTARRYSRRALKADPGNLSAARALAGIYVTGNDYDKAIDILDKASGLDANSAAMTELATYRIRRALMPANAAKFFGEALTVTELRRKAGDLALTDLMKQSAGANTPAAHNAIGDALLNAGRVHEAVLEYAKPGLGDDIPVATIDRYALALTLDDRPLEAEAIIKNVQLGKRADSATRAVLGLAYLRQQKFLEARNVVKQDLPDHVLAALIVASYADNALGNRKLATDEANDAVGLAPALGEAQYALAISTTKVDVAGEALNKALTLSPFQSGPYLEYTTDQLLSKRLDRFEQALNVTDMVLKFEPENVQAKIVQSLVYTQQKRYKDATPMLQDLQKKNPLAPDVFMTIGAFYQAQSNNVKATPFFDAARKSDPGRFNYTSPPTTMELMYKLKRFHYRADFYLTPSALFPMN